MWAPGTVFGNRYTLVEQLVDGGVAEVWWADDAVLSRRVVAKILHPELGAKAVATERFRDEARLVAHLDPPGADHVRTSRSDDESEGDSGGAGAGDSGGESESHTPYVVVQFVDRRPPSARADATGATPYDDVLDIVAQMLEALHAADRVALVRRDVVVPRAMARTLTPTVRRPARRRRQRASRAAALSAAVVVAAAGTVVLSSTTGVDSQADSGRPPIAQGNVLPGEARPSAVGNAEPGATATPSATAETAIADSPLPPQKPTPTPGFVSALPTGGPPAPGATPPTAPGSTGGKSTGSGAQQARPAAPRPQTSAAPSAVARAASTPPPTAARPAVAPAVPSECGGSGGITNVGSGMKIGIDSASPTAGSRLVTGGRTEYGWVTATVGPWRQLRICNTRGLTAVPATAYGGPVSLGPTTFTGGLLTFTDAAAPGSVLITVFPGTQCLTDNGPGRQLTFTNCVPGNTAQQWYVP